MSRVILDVQLANEPAVVTAGRRQLASLVEAECGEAIADLSLVVSELLANAVEHTTGDIRLRAARLADQVRVEVHDHSTSPPTPGRAALDDEYGRGLLLVEQVSTRWGFEPHESGKFVWAEVAC